MNLFKYLKYSLSLILTTLMIFTSCEKEIEKKEVFLICDAPSEIIFNADGTSDNAIVFIKSSGEWDVSLNPKDGNGWLEINNKGNNSFTLKASGSNAPNIPKEVIVTIKGEDSDFIEIKAKKLSGKYNFAINPNVDKIYFNAEVEAILNDSDLASEIKFLVETDLEGWEVDLSKNDDWLVASVNLEESFFTLKAFVNESSSSSENIIINIFYNNETLKSITAAQEAYNSSVPMTDINFINIEDGTKFIITYANNISREGILKDGKLVTRGVAGEITTIYSVSSEATGEVFIGREQDEKILLSFDSEGKLEFRKNSEDYILINTFAELAKINQDTETLAARYVQESDLNLLGDEFMVGQPTAKKQNWKTIGKASSGWSGIDKNAKTVFKGEYDGDNFSIGNFYIEDKNYLGLFGCIGENAIIKNINITSGTCKTEKQSGLVCGYNFGEINNCKNKATYAADFKFGGICGYNGTSGKIINCSNEGVISGFSNIGGICSLNKGTIELSKNMSPISVGIVAFGEIGGICAQNDGIIQKCSNHNSIIDVNIKVKSLGGICGVNQGVINDCYNESEISGFSNIGGIAGVSNGKGRSNKVTIYNCYNNGKIVGKMPTAAPANPTGGITGSNMFATIVSCVNYGEIEGEVEVGGISGYFYGGYIYSSYNTIVVQGKL